MPTRIRTALVTGANRGIGLEVCRQLARQRLRVILCGRDRAKADAAARGLARAGLDIVVAALDVTSSDSIHAVAKDIEQRFHGIDVLVNNAAVLLAENTDVLAIDADTYRATFETNVFGAIALSRAFVPGMVGRRYGRVVNVSSMAGQLATMGTYAPAYSMSKAALNAFTRQLAAATAGTGVLVNAACPGWVRTEMGGRNAPRTVEEGADTIVWLATLPPDGPSGGFFSDRGPIEW